MDKNVVPARRHGMLLFRVKKDLYLILHNIRSLHNVGSVFRTADAFGVKKIFLCGYTGSPIDKTGRPVKEIAKTALGAQQSVPWEHARQAWRVMEALKKDGVQVVVLENGVRGAISLQTFRPRFPVALVLGNEVKGISSNIRAHGDVTVAIPMYGKKESLNVSIACGVALWALTARLYRAGA